jgi:hypothetical protein
MEPLNYRIPTVVLSISFYVLFIGGDNGPTVASRNQGQKLGQHEQI